MYYPLKKMYYFLKKMYYLLEKIYYLLKKMYYSLKKMYYPLKKIYIFFRWMSSSDLFPLINGKTSGNEINYAKAWIPKSFPNFALNKIVME